MTWIKNIIRLREKDKYGDDDKKKMEWFLAEYGGKLPSIEHMRKLVGQQQAERICVLDKQRRRERHAKWLEEEQAKGNLCPWEKFKKKK